MIVSLADRLLGNLKGLMPVGLTVLLVLAAHLPYGSGEVSSLFPQFALISVFFWSVYQPNLMPAGAAFLIGFVGDVLSGVPLGLNALVLVLLQYAALHQRRAFVGRPFLVGWFGFAFLAAVAMVLAWLVASLYHLRVLDPARVLVQLAITVAVYPVVAELFGWLQRRFLR